MKIEGRNAVAEAIKSGKTIDRLVVSKDVKDAGGNRIIADAKSRNIKIMFYDKSVLDRESETKRHQGFIAEITDYNYSSVEEILSYASEKNEKPFIIIVDGVEDPHNLGSIIRVADCSGCHGVIIPRHRNVTVNETVIKVSAGAASHVKVAKVTNVNDAIEYLKQQNVWVYAAELGGDDIYKTNLTGAIAFVVGGEGKGVSKLTKQKCDGVITLPMRGQVNSLNASVAAGIVAYEYVRQNF
ncbi:MAG: 23S rRNA (guanosine(2251)-2'-O)-methyltransferase RlmB [Clostridiales bacterium]|nr:23S rRNA (guanosine(2251)-2'-O)-methyltransferase RlmB [Clostridiales bacterium]